jgi:hypothetical protein
MDSIRKILKEQLYGAPKVSQENTFQAFPFRAEKQGNADHSIGTAEFSFQYSADEIGKVLENIKGLLNDLDVKYWSVNSSGKVLTVSVTRDNFEMVKNLLSKYQFNFRNKTFGDEMRQADTQHLGNAYGLEVSTGNFGGGGMLMGNYAIDRLAGE